MSISAMLAVTPRMPTSSRSRCSARTLPGKRTSTPTSLGNFNPSRSATKSSQVISRLRRSALIRSCQSVTMPVLSTRKTLEPKLATRWAKYRFIPLISAITRISVETERMIPSRVRNERSLWARMVCSAISAASRRKCRERRRVRFWGLESIDARVLSLLYAAGARRPVCDEWVLRRDGPCPSIRPQGLDGIGRGGTLCGQDAGDGGAHPQRQDGQHEDPGIPTAHAEQLRSHQAAGANRQGNPDEQPNGNLQEGSAQHQAHDVHAVGAQRHAHSDFAGAAHHGVGGEAIEADGGQQQRDDAKGAGQLRHHALLVKVHGDLL